MDPLPPQSAAQPLRTYAVNYASGLPSRQSVHLPVFNFTPPSMNLPLGGPPSLPIADRTPSEMRLYRGDPRHLELPHSVLALFAFAASPASRSKLFRNGYGWTTSMVDRHSSRPQCHHAEHVSSCSKTSFARSAAAPLPALHQPASLLKQWSSRLALGSFCSTCGSRRSLGTHARGPFNLDRCQGRPLGINCRRKHNRDQQLPEFPLILNRLMERAACPESRAPDLCLRNYCSATI